jgi:light-regulated signal transduction histidine kinase (bacteriophytochrome)
MDVSEEKRLLEQMRIERERFLTVYDNIPEVLYVADTESYEILLANLEARKLFGDKLVGKKCYEVLQGLTEPCAFCTNAEMKRTQAPVVWEHHNKRIDRIFQVIDQLIPWPDGRMVRFEVAMDITELRQTEKKLQRRSQELFQSNQDLEQFAYVASHDLQEPLRMVASYLQLIEQRYTDKLDDDGREFIAFAVDGAQRMKQLILDLLAYSRLGALQKQPQRVSLNNCFEQALAGLRVSVDEKQAVVTRDELPDVIGDSAQLTQLTHNLIANALKFCTQAKPCVHLSSRRQNENWIISVKDNGIGIDPQYADRIFVIFKRLHHVDEYPGTGIGLALCKKIVERHGGRIWVESALGQGSIFSFSLPCVDVD